MVNLKRWSQMELNDMKVYAEAFRIRLDEVRIVNPDVAGHLNKHLGLGSIATGGDKGSGKRIIHATHALDIARAAQNNGYDPENAINNVSKTDINLKQQEKEQARLKRAAIYASKHHTPIAPVSHVSPQNNTPTIAVASQHKAPSSPAQQNKSPSPVQQNKSPLPAGHSDQHKLKRLKPFSNFYQNKNK